MTRPRKKSRRKREFELGIFRARGGRLTTRPTRLSQNRREELLLRTENFPVTTRTELTYFRRRPEHVRHHRNSSLRFFFGFFLVFFFFFFFWFMCMSFRTFRRDETRWEDNVKEWTDLEWNISYYGKLRTARSGGSWL